MGNWTAKLKFREQNNAIKSILNLKENPVIETVKTEIKKEVIPQVIEQPREAKKKENDKKGQFDLFEL